MDGKESQETDKVLLVDLAVGGGLVDVDLEERGLVVRELVLVLEVRVGLLLTALERALLALDELYPVQLHAARVV